MSDWTPEDVDALFQEGSEGYEFEYNEAAWGQMENLLERRDRRRRLIWWIFGATMSLLVLVSAYVIWGDSKVSNTDKLMESTIINQAIPLNEEETLETTSPKHNNQTTSPNTEITPIAVAKESLKKEATINPEKSNTQVTSIEKNTVVTSELAKKISKKVPLITKHNSNIDKRTEQKTTIITNNLKVEELVTNTTTVESPVSKKLENKFNDQKQITPKPRTALTTEVAPLPSLSMMITYTNTPVDFTTTLLTDLDEVPTTTTEQPSINPNHFVVGLLLSKEFSFVDMTNMTSLKWKAGLSLEYRFGGKHALKLGANYSQKDYMTSTIAKYKVIDGFWNKATAPNTASAICDVLELSLSESFFLKGHDKRGFFINAGLTSYFLLKEQYNYTYDTNDPELLWSWGENNTNRHWFGIGEVSVGYNLPFTDNSSLQIAPYAQIPLTGVGHGELKLFSSGVLIRYNFHLR